MDTGPLSSADARAVESFLAEWAADQRVPGASVAIVDATGERYAEGFGARDLDRNEPATHDTLFGFGSCTKSFTAMAIMQRVEAGDLALDDPVEQYLPHLADAPGEAITIEELLTHTSGMPSDSSAGPLISRTLGLGHIEIPLSSAADFRRHVEGSVDRRVTDRETFFYYNSGYTMLGLIVEEVTGEPYADYVSTNILDPLAMTRSTFDRDAFEADEDRMTPYVKQEGGSTESGFPFDPLIHAPGGLVSSVAEMATYLEVYLNDGVANGERVIAAESVDAMTTPHAHMGAYFDGTPFEYGYGLFVEEFLGDRMIGHGGSIGVSTAWFGYLEDAGVGVVVACTTGAEAHPMVVGPAVLAILADEEPEAVVPHFRLVSTLEAVTGEYVDYREASTATVERVAGGLKLELQSGNIGGQQLLLVPAHVEDELLICETVWANGWSLDVRFELGDEGIDLFVERARFEKTE